ncbi:MAG: DUF1311 domain-containing protein [Sphingomonadales bacterium]|nr:DUF1311 domain-containing protein [Sphingomonadales bacterium]MDE2170239.1 DUF1311 domain-containing protein [Sphingomonadales bacterium]
MLGLLALVTLAGAGAAGDPHDWHTRYTGRLSSTYWSCQRETGQGDYVYTRCAWEEYHRRDAELNAAYQRVIAALSPEARARLRSSQRAWIRRRDALCGAIRERQPGTNALHLEPQCLADQTIGRTQWLVRRR